MASRVAQIYQDGTSRRLIQQCQVSTSSVGLIRRVVVTVEAYQDITAISRLCGDLPCGAPPNLPEGSQSQNTAISFLTRNEAAEPVRKHYEEITIKSGYSTSAEEQQTVRSGATCHTA